MKTRGYSFQLTVAAVIVVADQLTKLLIRREFELYDTTAVIPNLFSLTRIHNTGAAFGLLDGVDLPFKTGLLALVSVAALVGLVMFAVSLPEVHRLARIGVALDRLVHQGLGFIRAGGSNDIGVRNGGNRGKICGRLVRRAVGGVLKTDVREDRDYSRL